jgi:hypothetical protein
MKRVIKFISGTYFWFQSLIFFGMAFLNFSDDRRFWFFTAAALACQAWAQLLEILRSQE